MINMKDYGHLLTTKHLRLKVALLKHENITSFKNRILGNSWLTWFWKRHPNLTTRQSQELEFARAKGLCAKKVASFYKNLQQLYDKHNYPLENIWNCDESEAQTRTSGGESASTKRVHLVQKLTPNKWEHTTTLSCINAARHCIPNFYILKGNGLERIISNTVKTKQLWPCNLRPG